MKKIKSITASLLVAAALLAPNFGLYANSAKNATPAITIRFEDPKGFSKNLTQVLRKVSKDPQIEMYLAMTLATLGYPEFHDVDTQSNVVVCLFLNDESAMGYEVFAIVKAGENSVVASNMNLMKKHNVREGDVLFIDLINPQGTPSKIKDYLPALKSQFAKKTCKDLINAEFDVKAFKGMLEELPTEGVSDKDKEGFKLANEMIHAGSVFIEELDYLVFAINVFDEKISAKFKIAALNGSALSKSFACMRSNTLIDEAKFIPSDNLSEEMGAMSQQSNAIFIEICERAFSKNEKIKELLKNVASFNAKCDGTSATYSKKIEGKNTPQQLGLGRTSASADEVFSFVKNYSKVINYYIDWMKNMSGWADAQGKPEAMEFITKEGKLSEFEGFEDAIKNNSAFANLKVMELSFKSDVELPEAYNLSFYLFKVENYIVYTTDKKLASEFLQNLKSPPSSPKKIDAVMFGSYKAPLFFTQMGIPLNLDSAKEIPSIEMWANTSPKSMTFSTDVPYKFMQYILNTFMALQEAQMQVEE